MTIELYLGDCLTVLPTLESGIVDAFILDPPYGIDYQSAWRIDRSQWKPKIANDKEPFLDWLPEAYRITKMGGALVCFCRWDVEDCFKLAIEQAGYEVKSQIIWDKVIHGMGDLNGSFAPQHENMWFAVKGDFKFWNERPKSIIRATRVSAEELVHPNEKPIPLYLSLIDSLVPPNGLLVDCFLGSGNSGKASQILGRNFIGVELDPCHYAVAQRRITEAQAQPSLPGILIPEQTRLF